MDLTPQFILEKLLEFAKAIEHLTNLITNQDDRLDALEARFQKQDRAQEKAEEQIVDDRKERRKTITGALIEVVKALAGAVVGVLSTLAMQHFFQHK